MAQNWTIGEQPDGTYDVITFSEDEDVLLEAMAAFRDERIGEVWFRVDEGEFGEHGYFVTYARGEDD